MDNLHRLIKSVQLFLKTELIDCEMVQEDAATCFWAYPLKDQKMTGFISFHEHDGDPVLSASLTIGLLKPDDKLTAVLKLLEDNMALNNGLSVASQLDMIVVRFNANVKLITPERILWLLEKLHIESNEIRMKFVINEHLLGQLPPQWFESNEQ